MKLFKMLTVFCLLLMAVCVLFACDSTGDDGGNADSSGDGVCVHEYVDKVTEATCTQGGYTTHTCSKCGESKKDSEVSAKGHDYAPAVTAATCTKDGYTTYTCSACNNSYKDDPTSALGHTWSEIGRAHV